MLRNQKLAKLSTPRVTRVISRPRLFRLLDSAHRKNRVFWIVAPPGAGKTSLVASWLAHRKLPHLWLQLDEDNSDIADFFHFLGLAANRTEKSGRLPALVPECLAEPQSHARRFFRALCAGPRSPAVLVLDDYHLIRSDSALHSALREGFAELPEGVTCVVMSRSNPPPEMARLRANGSMSLLRGDALLLKEGEVAAIARLRHGWDGNRSALRMLYARSEGWAAGLTLLLEEQRADAGARPLDGREQGLFDYFAAEVLARADAETRQVLLETALLPRVTAAMAERLTGVERAGEILADLCRRGYFVVRQGAAAAACFQYHALFREFLLQCAEEELAAPRLTELRSTAAALLEETGQIEEAVPLYLQAVAWGQAERVILSSAPALLQESRSDTVVRWVKALPEKQRDGQPWLLFFLGAAQASLRDFGEALPLLERAFEVFLKARDANGVYLSWAAIAEVYLYQIRFAPLNHWIGRLDAVRQELPPPRGNEVEAQWIGAAILALAHQQPWHPALEEWADRALRLTLSTGKPHLRVKVGRALLLYYGGMAMDLEKAVLVSKALEPLVTAPDADPVTAICWYMCQSVSHLYTGQRQLCLEASARGLLISAETGLRSWDRYLRHKQSVAAYGEGDLPGAEEALAQLLRTASDNFDLQYYYYGTSLIRYLSGDLERARQFCRMSLELGDFTDSVILSLIPKLTFAMLHPLDSRQTALEAVLHETRRCRLRAAESGCLLQLALMALDRGEEDRAVAWLRDGLAAGRRVGIRWFIWLRPAELAECCALALEHRIEPEYVGQLIGVAKPIPGERAQTLEAWPWELRIEAMAGLTVSRNGERLQSGRKVQKKPQELLQLLVAAGPGGQRPGLLAEALWPDADGDAGLQALKTTLHRLRRLLGDGEVVIQRNGRIALDPQKVFVDAWALEQLLEQAEAARAAGESGQVRLTRLLERIGKLGGVLTATDPGKPLLADLRQRLRQRVERLHPSILNG